MADHPVRGGNGHAPKDEVVPPATEQVHLPGPSYLPVIVAAGVTLAVVGVVFSFVVLAIGLIIALVGVVRWIGDSREEMAELPLEH
jgi:hypothetical protein